MRNNLADITLAVLIMAVVSVLCISCGDNREQRKQELRHELRSEFYSRELQKAQAELARTDSLMQIAEATLDSADIGQRIRLDSLRLEADVLGAKIRYIHRNQQEVEQPR